MREYEVWYRKNGKDKLWSTYDNLSDADFHRLMLERDGYNSWISSAS